ncbi:hypothetical protein UP09_23785 [Bradyrhizobium sp. LTSP885]|nr:hypothetical protein UP09_23785 [Bradyrhizobium sp. LTSP885]
METAQDDILATNVVVISAAKQPIVFSRRNRLTFKRDRPLSEAAKQTKAAATGLRTARRLWA